MAEASVVRLSKGEVLLQRGAKGGDLYLVESGSLEVVDMRQTPAVILEVLSPGRVVGEMSFVDESPRAADVRAVEDCTVWHWSQLDLSRLLDSDAALSSRFFRAISRSTIQRLRDRNFVTGRPSAGAPVLGGLSAAVAEEARQIALGSVTVLRTIEDNIRGESLGNGGRQEVSDALSQLVDDVEAWISGVTSVSRAREAGNLLRTELRHWLVRSRTGLIGLDHGAEAGASQSFLAHLLLNRAEGSDALGESLDAALLELPTPQGLRSRMLRAVDAIIGTISPDRPSDIAILQPSCGALLAHLLPRLAHTGGRVFCVDGDPQVLAFVDAGLQGRPTNIELQMVHQDLVTLSEGRSVQDIPACDVIVLNGLIDHLPARLIGSLLIRCKSSLRDGGVVVVMAMAPSKDARFVDHLLRWPLMRRTREELVGLCQAAGLTVVDTGNPKKDDDVGLIVVASVSVNGQS